MEVAEISSFEMQEMRVASVHADIFFSFPARHLITCAAGLLRVVFPSRVFQRFPELKKEPWREEFWEDAHPATATQDKITVDFIKRHVKYLPKAHGVRLKMF